MVTAVTFGMKKVNGKPVYTLITDPNTPHREQRRNFRKLRRELHGKFAEVQLWTSAGGRVKRQKTTDAVLPEVSPVTAPVPTPVTQTVETQPAADIVPASETNVSGNSGGEPTPTPVPDKKGAALAKARAAAAAKKAAKARDLLS